MHIYMMLTYVENEAESLVYSSAVPSVLQSQLQGRMKGRKDEGRKGRKEGRKHERNEGRHDRKRPRQAGRKKGMTIFSTQVMRILNSTLSQLNRWILNSNLHICCNPCINASIEGYYIEDMMIHD